MKYLVATFIFVFATMSFAEEGAPVDQKLHDAFNADTVKFLNGFASYNEQLDMYVDIKLFTLAQRDEVAEFLRTKNLKLDSKPAKVKNTNNKFNFGTTAWVFESSYNYKTEEGVIVKLKRDQNAVDLFKDMFNAFGPRSASLFFKSAYAEPTISERASAALGVVAQHSNELLHSAKLAATTGLAAFGGTMFGGIGWLAEGVNQLTQLANQPNTVRCGKAGNYILLESYRSNPFWKEKEPALDLCNFAKYHDPDYLGYSMSVCQYGEAAMDFVQGAFTYRGNEVEVSQARLKQIFQMDPPKCTTQNLKPVQSSITAGAKALVASQGGRLRAPTGGNGAQRPATSSRPGSQ